MDSRPGFTAAQKALMCISKETIEGLHITGESYIGVFGTLSMRCTFCSAVKSFVEVVRYLTTLPEAKGQYVLSECFSQDKLENYFGQVRAKGGQCEDPTAKSTLESAQSLRVQGSLAMQPVRGNSSRKRRLFHEQDVIDDSPLPKRKRKIKLTFRHTQCHKCVIVPWILTSPGAFEVVFVPWFTSVAFLYISSHTEVIEKLHIRTHNVAMDCSSSVTAVCELIPLNSKI